MALLLLLAFITLATTPIFAEQYCKCPASTGFVCLVDSDVSEYLSCDVIDGDLKILLSFYGTCDGNKCESGWVHKRTGCGKTGKVTDCSNTDGKYECCGNALPPILDATSEPQRGVLSNALSFPHLTQVRGSIKITAADTTRSDDFTVTFPSLLSAGPLSLDSLYSAVGTFIAPKLTCLGKKMLAYYYIRYFFILLTDF